MSEQQKNKQIVLPILKRIFGKPLKDSDDILEYEFNCLRPACRHDRDKYNLAFNAEKNQFHCWKCKYSGYIHRILDDYGTKDEIALVNSVFPRVYKKKEAINYKDVTEKDVICKLPYGYRRLEWPNKTEAYIKAINYLIERKVGMDKIRKHNIGYTDKGFMENRIVVPSYKSNGEVNYFVGRSFIPGTKPSYMAPSTKKVPKENVIFNECNVNFDLPIYLVEGVFDMFPLYNAVPMLGKFPSPLLMNRLLKHRPKVIICLDEDAIKDSIELYYDLTSYGLDAYFVEIPGDIAKYYQDYGHEALIKLLKNHRKIDFQYLLKLSMKDKKKNQKKYDEAFLDSEWNKLKESFKNLEDNGTL